MIARRTFLQSSLLFLAAMSFTCPSALAQAPRRPAGAPPAAGAMPSVDDIFRQRDANADGMLTKDEVPEAMWGRLSRADADGDGAVSKQELTTARQRVQGQPAEQIRPELPARSATQPAGDQGSPQAANADAKDTVKLRGGFTFTEGPAADEKGNVYFTDVRANTIFKVDKKGTLTTFFENSDGCNGLMFDAKGRLIACQGRTGRIIAIDVTTKKIDVLATEFNGKRFNSPNDLTVDRAGGVYFTDPAFGRGDSTQDKEGVYYVAPSGQVSRLIDDQPRPNGILLSPDEKTLYVLLSGRPALMAYAVESPGKLGPGKLLGKIERPGDGMTVDTLGNLYIRQPSLSRIDKLSPEGKLLGQIKVPENPSNCTFGGDGLKTLFITARTSVYTLDCDVDGHRVISTGDAKTGISSTKDTTATVGNQKPSGVRGTPSSRGVSKTFSNLPDAELIAELQKGGYVIAFRHGVTDWNQKDVRGSTDRASQRNLNDTGREESKRLGEAFKQLAIPIGSTLSSPIWRCRDTAELAFGKCETTRDLLGTVTPGTSDLLASGPTPGTNRVLVTHNQTLAGVLPVAINEVEEGNCVILQPQSGQEPRFIAHLAPKDWFRLVEQLDKTTSSVNALPVAPAENVQISRELEVKPAATEAALSAAAKLADLAGCWLGSLQTAQREKAVLPFDDPERLNWGYEPRERKGLAFSDMTSDQRLRLNELLAASLSERGLRQATTIMETERAMMTRYGTPIGPDQYFVTIFGQPGPTGTWAWRLEGHHCALNITLRDGQVVSTTPTMFGAFPATITEGPHQGERVLGPEEDHARQLFQSLTADQLAVTLVSKEAPRNVLSGWSRQAKPLAPAGLSASRLTADQLDLLRRIMDQFLSRAPPEFVAERQRQLESVGLDEVSFAWMGGIDKGQGHYYRIQSPTFLLEYCNTNNDPNHAHAVWREFQSDFGGVVLVRRPQ